MDVNKLRKFFLFDPYNTVMNNLEATTQLCGFNQYIPMQQSKKRFPYSGSLRHKGDAIKNFL